MGIFKDIYDAFFGPDPNRSERTYAISDLSNEWRHYKDHVNKALDYFSEAASKIDPGTLLSAYESDTGDSRSYTDLGRMRYTYLGNIEDWVDDLMYKLRYFCKSNYPQAFGGTTTPWKRPDPLEMGKAHIECANYHGKNMIKVIDFFLFDTRSDFYLREALGGDFVSAQRMADWYNGGRNSVDNEMNRIREGAARFVDWARRHYPKRN